MLFCSLHFGIAVVFAGAGDVSEYFESFSQAKALGEKRCPNRHTHTRNSTKKSHICNESLPLILPVKRRW